MGGDSLSGFFENFLESNSIFKNKKALQANFTPDSISHREDQIQQIAKILAPSLRLDKPSNLFIYGKTGTGKTLTIKHTTEKIKSVASERDIPVRIMYVNCKLKKVADTQYRLVAELAREFGKAIPPTGLPTDEVYKAFFDSLESKKTLLILVLDEIDQLVKKAGDEMLYNFTRINSELTDSQICIVGISNDLMFTDILDSRVKSSLSEEELVFPPYNAFQIQSILKQRASIAFVEDALTPGVVEKCAAYAAREHGDARRALELLRVAAEIAEREEKTNVTISHLDKAEEKIEHDRVLDIVATQPKQHQATLYSVVAINTSKEGIIFTGEVYELYKDICTKIGLHPLTQRRVSDVIAELDMLGIINAKVISKGRYGRTREITISVAKPLLPTVKKILEEGLGL